MAGATGAIGRRLVPMLLAASHDVTAMTRSPARAEELRSAGAEPVVADALDAEAVRAAIAAAAPAAIVHELTSIPQRIRPRRLERDFALNDKLRREGTVNLVAAAQAAGVGRIVVQSIAFSYAPGPPGTVHAEDDPLRTPAQSPAPYRSSAQALLDLERTARSASGLVLRYGYFYGPGTAFSPAGSSGQDIVRRRLPIVGDGGGVWSFVHIDDAASATVAALTHGAPGAYNVVDDEPAAVREWVPALASALGAPAPRRVPAALARLLAGSYAVEIMTRAQGAANGKATRELGWEPRYRSWRDGFSAALS